MRDKTALPETSGCYNNWIMKKVDFENGTITHNILQTAFPMLTAQVLNLLYSIVDRVYIGRIPGAGTEALGAVGLCFPVILLVTGFTNMFGMGGAPLFSMALGEKNLEKAQQIQNTAFRLLILCGTAIFLIGEIWGTPILRLFGASGQELEGAVSYLRIYLVGTLFIMIATGMNSYINAQGFPVIGMLSVTIGAAANLILDPVFIFGLSLGVRGAALATVLAQFLSFSFVLRFLFGKKFESDIDMPLSNSSISADAPAAAFGKTAFADFASARYKNEIPVSFAWEFPYAGEIISLGLAPFIMQVTNSLVQIVCNSVLMQYGGTFYVSVMTIVSSVRSILDAPTMAITDGASPVISYNYGAGRPGNVRKAIRVMMLLALPYTALIWGLVMLVPSFFVRIFSDAPEILEDASRALHLYFFAFVFQSFQYSGQTVFKALNKKGKAIFFSLFRKVILVVPLTFLLPRLAGLGTDGVFAAEPVSNVVGGLACFVTMLATVLPELTRMEPDFRKKTNSAE